MKIKADDTGIYLLKKLNGLPESKLIDDNTIEVNSPKIVIKPILKDNEINEFEIKASKEGLAFIKKIIGEVDYVKESDVKRLGINLEDLKTSTFDNLFCNRKEFLKRLKTLKDLVNNTEFNKQLPSGFINEKVTISFNPKITKSDGTEPDIEPKNEFGSNDKVYLPYKDTGKDVDFEDKDSKIVGRFFRSRNTMVIFANPWKDTNKLVAYLKEQIKKAKPIKEDTEKFKMISLAKIFTKDIEKRVLQKETEIKTTRKKLEDYQNFISNAVNDIQMFDTEVNALKGMKNNFKSNFFKELSETKRMEIIKDIEMTPTEVLVKYKPTCIEISNYYRDNKEFGKRSMYIGEPILRVCASGVKVGNDLKLIHYKTYNNPESGILNEYPHPHTLKDGSCCLGKEATKTTLFSLKSQCKIADLSLYFWMFIKNYGSDGGYMKPNILMDFCLMNGYPIFDEKGKHIYINDEKRLKSGEQIELKKSKDWEENVNKFKNFNPA